MMNYHSQVLYFFGGFTPLTHLGQEHVGCWTREIKAKNLENQMLHPKDLTLVVSVVSDVDKFPDVRRIDLFVFARDEHCSGAH